MNYYNENDQFNAQWLRNLVSAGLIPAGDVDGRCITEVSPSDLTGYTQCHFFAGIAGWSEALWLAGVDPSVRLWSGSCPCQPFSVAGKGKGTADKRHLWPVFRKLIDHCRPPIIFGEQVASPAGINWFRTVRTDLEALGYGVPGADLCSAGIGSPNIRQRIYWMAYSPGGGSGAGLCHREPGREWRDVDPHSRGNGGLADPDGNGCEPRAGNDPSARYGNSTPSTRIDGDADEANRFWGNSDWLWCRDGKWRPVEPGTFPLAYGIPQRVGRLRAYGNAICPPLAAAFIRAAMMS